MAEGGGEDRSQLIAHFQEITGIEDEDKILEHLRSRQWNLEAAVQDALNEKEGIRPVYGDTSSSPSEPLAQRVPTSVATTSTGAGREVARRAGWFEWFANMAVLPLQLVVGAINDLFQFAVGFLFGNEPVGSQNPQADALQFIVEFESQYGPSHPPFLVKSYDEALAQARKDLQFLLVYVHSPGHQDAAWFCKEVMASREFIGFVASNMILCFGVSVKTEEGVKVSYVLRENTYPFLALVVVKRSRLVVCERIEGVLPLPELIRRLQSAITDNEGELVVERTERFRRQETQQLREAQDQAFQESLAADRAKEKQREEDQSRAEALVREQERLKKQQEKEEEDFQVEKALCSSRLPPEPEAGDLTAMQVLLRMPSGHRLERRFRNTDKLQSVYDFAYTDESGQLPKAFTLVTNFPRKELVTASDGGPLLHELDLGKRCALFVQDDAA